MYKPGDLQAVVNVGECKTEDGYCGNYDHIHPMDARSNDGDKLLRYVGLPHSCDGWIIGDIEQIDMLVTDLMKAREILLKGERHGLPEYR